MKLTQNQLRGLIIYPLGDAIAQLILGELNLIRLLVLSIAGCFLYSYEINKWFGFIEKKFENPLIKTFSAIGYFNPLWIARHLLFIELAINPALLLDGYELWYEIQSLIVTGSKSFIGAILISIIANFIIQNKIPLKQRFLASATFSALMAVYYALSKVWF